jgi:hypothetical protein
MTFWILLREEKSLRDYVQLVYTSADGHCSYDDIIVISEICACQIGSELSVRRLKYFHLRRKKRYLSYKFVIREKTSY